MAPSTQNKRKFGDSQRKDRTAKPRKRIRQQKHYHSSSSEEEDEGPQDGFTPVNLNDSDDDNPNVPSKSESKITKTSKSQIRQPRKARSIVKKDDNSASDSDSDSDSNASTQSEADTDTEIHAMNTKNFSKTNTSKRNDPTAFSTSITKILSTKLPQSARSDPLLSRSRSAIETSTSLANERLEKKARAKIRTDKKEELERGRVRDILGLESGNTGEIAEEEKKLRKIAQRGVVKLFNAVRAAQVRGEQALKEERKKGTVGMKNREEKVREVTKEGFLDLISGKKSVKVAATA